MYKTRFLGYGLATSAFALLMAGSVAQATTIGFTPGAASGSASTNNFGGPSLNTEVEVDQFRWQSVNTPFATTGTSSAAVSSANTTAGTGLSPNELKQSWLLNVLDADGSGGPSAADTFSEAFSFSLQTTANDDGDIDTYGSNSGSNAFESHVYMTVVASGNLSNVVSGSFGQLSNYALTYTDVTFRMFLDDDGDFNAADTDTEIANFTGTGQGTNFVQAFPGSPVTSTLFWNASWDNAFEGVFEVPLDGADATDGTGLAAVRAGLSAFKLSQQSVIRNFVDFQGTGGIARYLLTSNGPATGLSEINVPEPGALALFGIGLLGLGAVARRRRRSS